MTATKILMIFALSTLGLTCCGAQTQASLKTILCGEWYTDPNPPSDALSAQDFLWGKGVTVVNGSMDIDTFSQKATISLPDMGGPFRITQLSWDGDDIINLSFFFDRGNFQVDYKVHYDRKKGTLWFEDVKNTNFIQSGPNTLWYKISGPEKK
jgi:hypothetical protein